MPRASRRQYDQIPSVEGDVAADGAPSPSVRNDGSPQHGEQTPLETSPLNSVRSLASDDDLSGKPLNAGGGDDGDEDGDDDDCIEVNESTAINIVILDSAQKKFPLRINPEWDILKLKRFGEKTHKVPPPQQRLIYRGKLLSDTSFLKECGITDDNTIIHLFPKPRVVVTSSSTGNSDDGGSVSSDANGAHIPQIVLDEHEAERRGQILVLGSHEVIEAQNNVKLLSLLLMVFCSMRLLQLFAIAMGIAEEPSQSASGGGPNSGQNHTTPSNNDDIYNPSDSQIQHRPWENSDYFDLMVSSVGFYVATLGMKATNENTLRLAQSYFVGTFVAGTMWNAWNVYEYIQFVMLETSKSDESSAMDEELTKDDFITVAFFMVLLPLFIWFLCCFRAWEFRNLLQEAEDEAAERIRSQLQLEGENGPNDETSHEMTQINSERAPIV